MLMVGKTLNEIKEYFVSDDTFVGIKFIKENGNGAVFRLKYLEERYSPHSWTNKMYEEAAWLVVVDDIVKSAHHMKRIALARIGIYPERKIRKRIIRDQKAHEFDMQICKDASEAGNIGGWCGIRAYCNVTNTPFKEGLEKCSKYGWSRGGMYSNKLIQLLKDEEFAVEEVTDKIRKHAKTIKTFEEQGWRDTFLILVSGHFVSSVRGTITDHTYGKKRIIKRVWKISKKS